MSLKKDLESEPFAEFILTICAVSAIAFIVLTVIDQLNINNDVVVKENISPLLWKRCVAGAKRRYSMKKEQTK